MSKEDILKKTLTKNIPKDVLRWDKKEEKEEKDD